MNNEDAADLLTALDCGAWARLLLAVEHFALWRYQQHMSGHRRPGAYVLGTATLLLGVWRWALLRGRVPAAVAVTLLVGVAGVADLLCYAGRAWQDRADAHRYGWQIVTTKGTGTDATYLADRRN